MKPLMDKVMSLLNEWAARPSRHILWFSLVLFSLMGMVDLGRENVLPWPHWIVMCQLLAVASLKASAIWLLMMAASRRRILRVLIWCIVLIYGFFCFANWISYVLYGFGISHRMMAVLSQTFGEEIIGFMPGFIDNLRSLAMSGGFLIGVLIIAGGYILMSRIGRRAFLWSIGVLSAIGIFCLGQMFTTMVHGRNALFISVRVPKYIIETRREIARLNEMMSCLGELPEAASVKSAHDAELVVMVVGESASSGHWSLYGYPLPTTARLDAMRDSLIVMEDAIGSSTTTAVNMERIMTLMNDDSPGNWYDYPMLLDIMNVAGYKTYWLSTQQPMGTFSNSTSAMTSRADEEHYLGAISSEDALDFRYDDVLMKPFEQALADSADCKFIGMHLMGSHTEYRSRYPKNFAKFTADDVLSINHKGWINRKKGALIAQYDNSILFTDSLLAEIISRIAKYPGPAAMVYFSDHGENVYDTRDFRGRDREHVRVPMIMYFNYPYLERNPVLAGQLREVASIPFSTSRTPQLLMLLTGTSYGGNDPARDILSPELSSRVRYVDGEPWSD